MISSKDVAKMAGVSQATVSRVMNKPESVKPGTRIKVKNAMEQLRYQPNLIARSLVMKSTNTIALISGTLKNEFYVETTDSIVKLATHHGYNTVVYFESGAKLNDIFDSVLGSKVDGFLLSSISLEDPLFEKIEKSGIPYMFFNRRPISGGNYVVLDNILAGELITNHLIDLGHEKIAYVSGALNISTFLERKTGFENAMIAANLQMDSELIQFVNPTSNEIQKVTWNFMHRQEPPTAVIYATDSMALQGMDAIMSMGLRIPEDVSLVGIDDNQISSHQMIQLTTAGHQKYSMGEIAVENLIEMIGLDEMPKSPRQIILKPEVIVRKTTARKR